MRNPAPLVPLDLAAELFTALPEALHYQGEPTEWVRTTRPGQRLHSFLEAPCFDAEGRLWLVDVPYGRLFRVDPDGGWSVGYTYDGEPHGLARLPDGRFAMTCYRHGLLGPDGMATDAEGRLAVAQSQIGRAWVYDRFGDPLCRIHVPGGSWTTSVAFSPDGRWLVIVEAQSGALYRVDLAALTSDPHRPGSAPR